MGEILPFRRPSPKEKAKGRTLCRHGFHKWIIWKARQFEVKEGRLVTVFRCSRCGATRNQAL